MMNQRQTKKKLMIQLLNFDIFYIKNYITIDYYFGKNQKMFTIQFLRDTFKEDLTKSVKF